MKTMRAVVFAENGGAEVLREQPMPVPVPGPTEVLVRVKACGLNHLDLWVRQGLPNKIPMPHIGGCEIVGAVAEIGSGVTGLELGQSVMISPGQGCGHCRACFRGDDSACPRFEVPGEHGQGGFAEFAKADARHIIPLSDAWSCAEWAATPLVFLTAWHMLHWHGRVMPGDDVLIQAAASGVGSAAIQIAKSAGARVFATAGSTEKLQLAKQLGADVLINYREEKFSDVVQKHTGKRGVDIVVEHIGLDVWKDSLRCLAHGGRLVTCGATSGPQVPIDLRFFFIREIQVLGSMMGSRSELDRAINLLDRKLLRPVLDRTFPLTELAQAQQYLAERKALGKVVIEVP